MISERGEVAMALAQAAAMHEAEFPAEVEDTPRNRRLWDQIKAGTARIEAAGRIPDVPAE